MASTSPEYGVSPIERLIRDAAVSLAIKRYIAERQTISVVQTCKDVPEDVSSGLPRRIVSSTAPTRGGRKPRIESLEVEKPPVG